MRFALLIAASSLALGCDDSASSPARQNDARVGEIVDARIVDTPDTQVRDFDAADARPAGDGAPPQGDAEVPPADAGPPSPDARPPDPPDNCPEPRDGRLGAHLEDLDGDPLDIGDRVRVTLELMSAAPSDGAAWIEIRHANIAPDLDTLRRDDAPVPDARLDGNALVIPLAGIAPGVFTYEATAGDREALLFLLADLQREEGQCPNPGGSAGVVLQLIGGASKAPICLDLTHYASLQIAPQVRLRSTADYLQANGARDDLLADDFIYCPQAPTVVHTAELCVLTAAELEIRVAGSYHADGDWEVDDFLLFEVFRAQDRLADGVTTQRHPGGNTFWCPENQTLMCTEGCTATLTEVAAARQIPALDVVDSTGGRARLHADGAVRVDQLLPADGASSQLIVTALDVGVEGTVRPALYLVISR